MRGYYWIRLQRSGWPAGLQSCASNGCPPCKTFRRSQKLWRRPHYPASARRSSAIIAMFRRFSRNQIHNQKFYSFKSISDDGAPAVNWSRRELPRQRISKSRFHSSLITCHSTDCQNKGRIWLLVIWLELEEKRAFEDAWRRAGQDVAWPLSKFSAD